MNDYSINTTNKCNWNCPYCLTQTHTAPERNIDTVITEMDNLKNNSTFSLCGGEPGMLSENEMDMIFEKAKEKGILPLDVLTNGLFIKKHAKHLKDVDTIHYHCVQSLKDDIIFYDVPKHIDLDYTIIVTESEYNLLDNFMEKYNHIEKFSIIPARKYDSLGKINFVRILKKYKHKLSERVYTSYFRNDCNPIGF